MNNYFAEPENVQLVAKGLLFGEECLISDADGQASRYKREKAGDNRDPYVWRNSEISLINPDATESGYSTFFLSLRPARDKAQLRDTTHLQSSQWRRKEKRRNEHLV